MRDHRSTGTAPRGRATNAGLIEVAFGLLILLLVIAAPVIAAPPAPGPVTLNPTTIPKWVNQLNGPPPVYVPVSSSGGVDTYEVNASEFTEQILPTGMPQTTVWGYGGMAKDAVSGQSLGFIRNSPGPSFEITRNTTTRVKWINDLTNPHLFAVDPTIMWADPNNLDMGGMGSMLGPPFLAVPAGVREGPDERPDDPARPRRRGPVDLRRRPVRLVHGPGHART